MTAQVFFQTKLSKSWSIHTTSYPLLNQCQRRCARLEPRHFSKGRCKLQPYEVISELPITEGKQSIRQVDSKDSDVLIELCDVHKSFGTKTVLAGASFSIRRGEAVGIIGPSGTGKSTILKIMSGLMLPDKGEVKIKGVPRNGLISDDGDHPSLKVGMVFQSAALFDSLTVGENVGFMLYEHSSLPEWRIRELVAEALDHVGLQGVEDKMPPQLSGGMKKRVALARAIISDHQDQTGEALEEVVLYDEPTAGLDPIASTVVEDLIRSLHGQSTSPISSYAVVTHQFSTIHRAVDRLVFLHEGKVAWDGPSSEFMSTTHPVVSQFAQGSLEGPIQY